MQKLLKKIENNSRTLTRINKRNNEKIEELQEFYVNKIEEINEKHLEDARRSSRRASGLEA